MYIIGEEEIEAITSVIRSKELFRYGQGDACATFEKRYAAYLHAPHFRLTCSGSYALHAALVGLGVGPGDEVIVPAHTYMATATSVLSVGAIPVVVDVDESITMDPDALDDAVGPRTRAVIRSTSGVRHATWTPSWRSPQSTACWFWRTPARASAAATKAGCWAPSVTPAPIASTTTRTSAAAKAAAS